MAREMKRAFPGARRSIKKRNRRIAAERVTGQNRLTQVGTIATAATALAAVAALVFTGFSLQESRAQKKISEQGQITSRYTSAVNQMGSPNVDVRLGGIFALERIMRNSPPDQPTIVEVLSAFIRNHPPGPSATSPNASFAKAPTDISAVLTVLGRRDRAFDKTTYEDLSDINFHNVYLYGADMSGAHLSGADLSGADLIDAHLSGANLYQANLSGATLYLVDLSNASLYEANVTSAHLDRADLKYANMINASLTGVSLYLADLSSANLTGANLTGANLTGANLWNTKMCDGSKLSVPKSSASWDDVGSWR